MFYREYRPKNFGSILGQDRVVDAIKNSVADERVAHAYLFSGPRGTGKTSTARILAQAVNCPANWTGEACGECDACGLFARGEARDLIEIDAATSRGIDDMRRVTELMRHGPVEVARKVYIIDEVHMLTEQAFNALLKSLEEPPPHVMFILATTDVNRVPETVVSRCQRCDFVRVSLEDIVGKLRVVLAQEGVTAEDGALELIGRCVNGGMRDAENILERAVLSFGSPITEVDVREMLGLYADEDALAFCRAVLERDLGSALRQLAEIEDEGKDFAVFRDAVVDYLRLGLLLRTGVDPGGSYGADVVSAMTVVVSDKSERFVADTIVGVLSAELRHDRSSGVTFQVAVCELAGYKVDLKPAAPFGPSVKIRISPDVDWGRNRRSDALVENIREAKEKRDALERESLKEERKGERARTRAEKKERDARARERDKAVAEAERKRREEDLGDLPMFGGLGVE